MKNLTLCCFILIWGNSFCQTYYSYGNREKAEQTNINNITSDFTNSLSAIREQKAREAGYSSYAEYTATVKKIKAKKRAEKKKSKEAEKARKKYIKNASDYSGNYLYITKIKRNDSKNFAIKSSKSLNSEIIHWVNRKSKIYVIEESDSFFKVYADGYEGYIFSTCIESIK